MIRLTNKDALATGVQVIRRVLGGKDLVLCVILPGLSMEFTRIRRKMQIRNISLTQGNTPVLNLNLGKGTESGNVETFKLQRPVLEMSQFETVHLRAGTGKESVHLVLKPIGD